MKESKRLIQKGESVVDFICVPWEVIGTPTDMGMDMVYTVHTSPSSSYDMLYI